MPESDAGAFRAASEAWFDMGDGRPFFVFEDVVAVEGRRGALVRLHTDEEGGERGGSHLLAMRFDQAVLSWERMVALDPEDVDAGITELDTLTADIDD